MVFVLMLLCKFAFWYFHFLIVGELRLLMERQRSTQPRGAGTPHQRRARKERTRAKPCEQGVAR